MASKGLPGRVLQVPRPHSLHPAWPEATPRKEPPNAPPLIPFLLLAAGLKEEAPTALPAQGQGWQAESGFPMQGKGKAAHAETKASPQFPQNQGGYASPSALCSGS